MTRRNQALNESLARSTRPLPEVAEPTLDQYYIQMGKDLIKDYKDGLLTKVQLRIKWDLMKAEYSALKGR